MNPIEAFHTAARRYCMDRPAALWETFTAAGSLEEERKPLEHKLAFTRAMLTDIESFVPGDFGSLEEAQGVLFQAGQEENMAEKEAFWKHFPKKIADEERGLYQQHLESLVVQPNWTDAIVPLPYRRVLLKQESEDIWKRLKDRWQADGGYWYPRELIEAVPPLVIVFDAEVFDAEVSPEVIHSILIGHGVKRVFILCEFQEENEYEIDVSLLEPWYGSSGGGELYCTSPSMDWLIYASHENAMTFAGEWLIEAVQFAWKDWERHIWLMSHFGHADKPDIRSLIAPSSEHIISDSEDTLLDVESRTDRANLFYG